MARQLPSTYHEALQIAQLVHELADYSYQLEAIAMSVADEIIHTMPKGQGPCKCSQCDLIRTARRVLDARRRKAKEET